MGGFVGIASPFMVQFKNIFLMLRSPFAKRIRASENDDAFTDPTSDQ